MDENIRSMTLQQRFTNRYIDATDIFPRLARCI